MNARLQGLLDGLLLIACVTLVLSVHGALPGLTSPTLGQAVWTAGFGQSYANQSLLSIYANNFGGPNPAAIAFGLAGAYPAGVFMFLGLHPVNAYAAMVVIWLLIAFAGAFFFARKLGLKAGPSLLAATLWLCMPVVWVHGGYAMLSLGMALLPTYLLSIMLLVDGQPLNQRQLALRVFFTMAVCLMAVFMDGYTFVMFAVAASIFVASRLIWPGRRGRSSILRLAVPTLAACFGLAYFLYVLFQGVLGFGGHNIAAFRGWGVDLTFLVQPTRNINWLADALSWSLPREKEDWFGDGSVWTASYCLPLIIAGGMAAAVVRPRREVWAAFVLIAVVGFYFSLGPSLKINSRKPDESLANQSAMSAEYALGPTGSSWISINVPGFKEMRSAYRWVALGCLGLWALTLLALATRLRQSRWQYAVLLILIVLLIPNVPSKVRHHAWLRETFIQLDRDIFANFGQDLSPGETVVFLPYRNDFLVNYLAARLGIHAYNIGGDKNLVAAKRAWPEEIRRLRKGEIDSRFEERITSLLSKARTDVVVLPFINMHLAANKWPYPAESQDVLSGVIKRLAMMPELRVVTGELYATVRLRNH